MLDLIYLLIYFFDSDDNKQEEGSSISAAALQHLSKQVGGHEQVQTRSQGQPRDRVWSRSQSRSGRLWG